MTYTTDILYYKDILYCSPYHTNTDYLPYKDITTVVLMCKGYHYCSPYHITTILLYYKDYKYGISYV